MYSLRMYMRSMYTLFIRQVWSMLLCLLAIRQNLHGNVGNYFFFLLVSCLLYRTIMFLLLHFLVVFLFGVLSLCNSYWFLISCFLSTSHKASKYKSCFFFFHFKSIPNTYLKLCKTKLYTVKWLFLIKKKTALTSNSLDGNHQTVLQALWKLIGNFRNINPTFPTPPHPVLLPLKIQGGDYGGGGGRTWDGLEVYRILEEWEERLGKRLLEWFVHVVPYPWGLIF